MNKTEFLSRLRVNLCGASEQDVKTAEDFYCEMIDDRVESGMSEQEAVESLGSPEDAAKNILLEMPLGKLLKVKAKRTRRLSALEIVLLILGFPVWGSLLISAVAVVLSVYLSLWAVIISLYAATFALVVSALPCAAVGIWQMCAGNFASGLFVLGGSVAALGIGVLLFFVSHSAAKGVVLCGKLCIKVIKSMFVRRGDKQ